MQPSPERSTPIKRTTLALVAATLAVPAASAATAEDRTDQPAAAPRTQLTLAVDDCEGCRIQLTSARGTYAEANAGTLEIWRSGAPGPASSGTDR